MTEAEVEPVKPPPVEEKDGEPDPDGAELEPVIGDPSEDD